jgi:hypothetical protein
VKTGAFESVSWLLVGAGGVAAGWLLPLDIRKRPSSAPGKGTAGGAHSRGTAGDAG